MARETGTEPRQEAAEAAAIAEKSGETGVQPRIPLPPWDMYTVFVAIMSAYLLLPLAMGSLANLVAPLMHPSYRILIEQMFTLVSWGAVFAFLGWRYRQTGTPMSEYLGLTRNRPRSYFMREAFYLLISMLSLMVLFALVSHQVGVEKISTPYTKFSSAELRVIAMFAIISAPLLEEIVFRGFVQATFHKIIYGDKDTAPVEPGPQPAGFWRRLASGIVGPWRAVIFTCLFFLLLHMQYFNNIFALCYVTLLGTLLGYWRERTQSIIPGIVGHMFNNVLASMIMMQG